MSDQKNWLERQFAREDAIAAKGLEAFESVLRAIEAAIHTYATRRGPVDVHRIARTNPQGLFVTLLDGRRGTAVNVAVSYDVNPPRVVVNKTDDDGSSLGSQTYNIAADDGARVFLTKTDGAAITPDQISEETLRPVLYPPRR